MELEVHTYGLLTASHDRSGRRAVEETHRGRYRKAKTGEKQSLPGVNEHLEPVITAMAAQIAFQQSTRAC